MSARLRKNMVLQVVTLESFGGKIKLRPGHFQHELRVICKMYVPRSELLTVSKVYFLCYRPFNELGREYLPSPLAKTEAEGRKEGKGFGGVL